MLFALEPEDVERFAIPIALGIAALLAVAVPPLRRALVECFRAGQRHGRRLSGKEDHEPGAEGADERQSPAP
jgi:hypothetical protein